MELGTAVSIAGGVVGIIVWLVRLEGRVNGHDDVIKGFRDDLHYIRGRIDDRWGRGEP